MRPDFTFTLLVAVLGVSSAINGFFLKEAWRELRELRACDRQREVDVAELRVRVAAIERA